MDFSHRNYSIEYRPRLNAEDGSKIAIEHHPLIKEGNLIRRKHRAFEDIEYHDYSHLQYLQYTKLSIIVLNSFLKDLFMIVYNTGLIKLLMLQAYGTSNEISRGILPRLARVVMISTSTGIHSITKASTMAYIIFVMFTSLIRITIIVSPFCKPCPTCVPSPSSFFGACRG